jgi:hypothetical protein
MSDKNFLSPINFKFAIDRLPNMEYYSQQVNLPSVSMGIVTNVPSPFGQNPLHGDKLEFGAMNVTIRVDEDMDVYLEIYNWMRSIADPEGFDGYEALRDGPGIYSDASLIILNNSLNPQVEVKFYDMFPVSIGDIQFNTTDNDVASVTVDITFSYRFFDLRKVT